MSEIGSITAEPASPAEWRVRGGVIFTRLDATLRVAAPSSIHGDVVSDAPNNAAVGGWEDNGYAITVSGNP